MSDKSIAGVYTITGEIGKGGGGIVYKAYHERLRKNVVLKQILAGSFAALSVRNEADLLKGLKHTYLPQVIDFVEDDGKIYTVMDYIEGCNLTEYCSGRKLTGDEIIRFTSQLCEAVDYLHTQKKPIIHSDIKPDNIMITPEKNICLIDFNISLLFENSANTYFGTRGYAAPEQIGVLGNGAQDVSRGNSAKRRKAEKGGTKDLFSHGSDAGNDKPVPGGGATEFVPEGNETELAGTEYAGGTEYVGETEYIDDKTEQGSGDGTEYLYGETGDSDTEYIGLNETKHLFGDEKKPREEPKEPLPQMTDGGKSAVTELSDIYSMGAVMYYMIMGRAPSYETGGTSIPKKSLKSLPEGLAVIAEKAMSREPFNRYRSAHDMLSAVSDVMKLDRRYRSLRASRIVVSLLCAAGLAASGFTVKGGLETVAAEREEKYGSYIIDAKSHISAGDLASASASAEAAKEFMPERPEAYYEELRILFEKGDYESCLDRYKVNERILGTAGTELTGNIRLILANCCFESGDYEQAVKYYQSSLEYNSSLTECYRDMAISLARLGDIEGASDALVLAESAGVSNDQLLLIRAEVESAKNNYAEALTLFENTAESTDDEYILFRALAQFSGICADHGSEIPGSYRRAAALLEKYGSSVSTSYSDYVTEMLANQYTYIGDEENDDEYLRRAVNEYKKLMDEQTMKYVVCRNCFELQNRLKDYNDCLNTLGSMYHSFGSDYWIMKSYAYTLIYLQDTVDVSERDYTAAYQYYLSAKELYEEKKKNGKTDPSMDILDEHIEQIREKGWKLGKE